MGENYSQPAQHKDWRPIVLDALRDIPNIVRAAKIAGISRRTIYLKTETDPVFKSEVDEALKTGIEHCESEVHRRAFEGNDVPKTIAGQRELVREYSDTLAIFLLKAHCPEKYRERYETQNPTGGPTVNITLDFSAEAPGG